MSGCALRTTIHTSVTLHNLGVGQKVIARLTGNVPSLQDPAFQPGLKKPVISAPPGMVGLPAKSSRRRY